MIDTFTTAESPAASKDITLATLMQHDNATASSPPSESPTPSIHMRADGSVSTINPHDSISYIPSVTTSAMCNLASDEEAFKLYLEATGCVVDKGDTSLSQQLSEEVNMILGVVPEMFHVVDVHHLCRRVMENLGGTLKAFLSTYSLNEEDRERMQNEVKNLRVKYRLGTLDDHGLLELAALAETKVALFQDYLKIYKPSLEIILSKIPSTWLSSPIPTPHYYPLGDILESDLRTLIKFYYDDVQHSYPGIPEALFRLPLDYVVLHIYSGMENTGTVKKNESLEHYSYVVAPRPGSQLPLHPGQFLKADLFIYQHLTIFEAYSIIEQQELCNQHKKLLDLIRWGKADRDRDLHIPKLPCELKTDRGEYHTAINQCIADLMIGATVNELLNIQFPLFGLVITPDHFEMYAARAHAQSDGTFKYVVKLVQKWGPLSEYLNYLIYINFLVQHRNWFKENVLSEIADRQRQNPLWVVSALQRNSNFKPWQNKGHR